MTASVFIFGAGYSGQAFAATRPDAAILIAGTTRMPANFSRLEQVGIVPFLFDSDRADDLSSVPIDTPTPSPSPQGGGELSRFDAEPNHQALAPGADAAVSPSPLWGGVRGGGDHSSAHRAVRAGGFAANIPTLFSGDALAWLARTTHLVISIAPDERGDPVLGAARGLIAESMPGLRWIGYLSTIGVYGDHRGEWVDETSQCRPVSPRSRLRLAAERQWLDLGEKTGLPVAVLRLSGIYGPGRNAFVNLANGTAKRLVKPGQVFNRIHAEDIAGSLWHLIGGKLGGIFNVTDDLPAPPQHVVAYAAELMGVEPPPEIPFESAALSPMARSFYGENKRVSNARLKASGYRFRFPDYRSALQAMWTARTWAGEGDSDQRSPMKMS